MSPTGFLVSLLASFGTGVFGTALGGAASFVPLGLIALAGTIANLAGASDIATAAFAFGTVFGPHMSFAGAVTAAAYAGKKGYLKTGGSDIFTALYGLKRPDVLFVGGITGIAGFLFQSLYSSVLHLNTDTVALTVVTLGFLTRFLIGKSNLGIYENGEKRQPFTMDYLGNTLLLAIGLGTIICGTGKYLMITYPERTEAIIGNYPNLLFGISAITFLLMLSEKTRSVPATHHITLTTALAFVYSGSIIIGMIFALISAFLCDFFNNNINSHVDTHWDGPAMTMLILESIIFALFR